MAALTIETATGFLLVLAVISLLIGGLSFVAMRVFAAASQGPASMTVIVMLSFLTAMSIGAAVIDTTRSEFITLAATGLGALAGAVTALYGSNNQDKGDK